MKRDLLFIIFIFCLYQFGFAQSLKRIGTLERKNDSIFVVENGRYYVANKNIVTVKLKTGISGLDKASQKIRSNRLGFIDLVVPEGIDLEEYVSILEKSGKYDLIEYNNIGKYSAITNDTQRNNQWYLSNINAFNAWDITMGSSNTTVAILDSGTDWRHPDIGIGSDGYKNIDEEAGWNYISNTNNVITVNGHGTRVAGIVAAKSNNFRGMSGMSGGNNSTGITMIPFCVGINSPDGSVIDDAIIDAIDIGARVIQLSLNVGETNAINAAIEYAVQNNAIIVCASGNGFSSTVGYPASHQNVIAVGATNKSNVRADFSNYGTSLDVVAPGVDIFSTTLNNGYSSDDGTSFAAPQVSGTATLILSVRPDLTGQQVRNVIEQTTQKIGGYSYVTTSSHPNGTWNQEMGYGLLNTHAAVYSVAPRITGSSQICNQATYTINNFPQGATVNWIGSKALKIISGQGTSSVVCQKTMYALTGTTLPLRGVITFPSGQTMELTKNIFVGTYPPAILLCPATDIPPFAPHVEFGYTNENYYLFAHGANMSNNASDYLWRFYSSNPFELPVQGIGRYIEFSKSIPGEYQVSVQYNGECGWSAEIFRNIRFEDNLNVNLYPNPATDILTADITSNQTKSSANLLTSNTNFDPYTIQLWNEYQGHVRSFEIIESKQQLSLQGLPSGMYIALIIKDGKTHQRKIVWKN